MTAGTTRKKITDNDLTRVKTALLAKGYSYMAGSTHTFYHYPARFSPEIAHEVIDVFSKPGDWVLDPFMGGGTTVIEGLRLGRKVIGIDLNALAHFVSTVRTTPLSSNDKETLEKWALNASLKLKNNETQRINSPKKNLPMTFQSFMDEALQLTEKLRLPRQQAFARCVLLRLGQWALDGREFSTIRRKVLSEKFSTFVNEMLDGLENFVEVVQLNKIKKSDISNQRVLLNRTAVGFHENPEIKGLKNRPTLVMTSPPYPGVHVLYHRWQYRGRKETDAPYWIANVNDGFCESYYTGGSRTPTGETRYFRMITGAFQSVRKVIAPSGLVVQLVGFANTEKQLPRYLEAMEDAGFKEYIPSLEDSNRLGRQVPNRKWYARVSGKKTDASSELLLFHRPS